MVARIKLPTSLHGDAVPCVGVGKAAVKSYDAYSWRSILARGKPASVLQYLFGIFEACKCKPSPDCTSNSMEDMWRPVLWSFLSAYSGTFDSLDEWRKPNTRESEWIGKELAGGFFLVIWSILGDLDHFAKNLFLKHYGANEFCEFCPATTKEDVPGMICTNFSPHATWKTLLYTADQWRSSRDVLHWLWQVFPFLSQHNLEPDELHVLYLGTLPILLGSVLWLLCYRCLLGSPEDNLLRVWSIISKYYRENQVSTQFSGLTLNSFTNAEKPHADYPVLKGKGAECKDLVAPLHSVWVQLGNDDFYEYVKVRALMEAQLAAIHLLRQNAKNLFSPLLTRVTSVLALTMSWTYPHNWLSKQIETTYTCGNLFPNTIGSGTWRIKQTT